MKKRLVNTFLGLVVLSMAITGCSHQSTTDNITVFGQVSKIDGKHITISLIEKKAKDNKELDKKDNSNAGDDESQNGKDDNKDSTEVKKVNPEKLTLTGEEQVIAVSDKTEVEWAKSPGDNKEKKGEKKSDDKESNDKKLNDKKSDNGKLTGEKALNEIKVGDIVTAVLDGAKAKTFIIQSDTSYIGELKKAEAVKAANNGVKAGSVDLTGVIQADGKRETSENESVNSVKENQNVVLVENGGSLNMKNGKLSKAGDTSSVDDSNYTGLNAVFLTTGGSESSISNSEITSASVGANAIFATGEAALIHVNDLKAGTTGDYSRGLYATFGGSVDAEKVDIITSGQHSTPISTGRGGGTVNVTDGTIASSGDASPCIYSTGEITAEGIIGNSAASQILVVEGKNSAVLKKCKLSGAGENGILLYQSSSGDAAEGAAKLKAVDSSLTTTSKGPMFYVTNTQAEVTLENTVLKTPSKVLVKVAGNDTNNWGVKGRNGGNFTLIGVGQVLTGDIVCDKISSIAINLKEKSDLKGTLNEGNKGGHVEIKLDKTSKWELTGDSYVNVITNEDNSCANIQSNGHNIYYDASDAGNSWLSKKTVSLSGGGKLMPK